LAALEQTVTRVDQNLGTLSSNVDVVATDLAQIRTGLAATESSLRSAVANQQGVTTQIDEVNAALVTLEETRQRFDIFVSALSQALVEMNADAALPAAPSAP